MENPERYMVPAVQRAIRALEILSASPIELTLSELSAEMKVPKSSLFRILVTLEALRMVQQDHERKKFSLGMKVVEFGSAKLGTIDPNKIARPHLERYAQETRESVYLGVLDHGMVILLQHIDSPEMWKIVTRLGNASPVHCTAIGQVLLAELPKSEVAAIIRERGLDRYTKKTITSESRLYKRLAQVRAKGYAVVDGEYKLDLCAVAVPIRDSHGHVVAAVMSAIPSGRPDKAAVLPRLTRALQKTGAEISRDLGYRG